LCTLISAYIFTGGNPFFVCGLEDKYQCRKENGTFLDKMSCCNFLQTLNKCVGSNISEFLVLLYPCHLLGVNRTHLGL